MTSDNMYDFYDFDYEVVYADPPWKYDNEKNNDPKLGGFTYKSMLLEDIMAMPLREIVSDSCALFLWATMPKLPEAFSVISAWGFNSSVILFFSQITC